MKRLCNWLLYRVMGWQKNITVPLPRKYIICLAPHTSNWDFLMKKEWFFWPLGPIFRRMGGIPVFRSKNTSLTDNLAEEARKADTFVLCITPEGTRKATDYWKRGFYYIAQKAQIPVLLFGLDFATKTITCTKEFIPSGDIENEMLEIKAYFKDFKGKKPQNFTTGIS